MPKTIIFTFISLVIALTSFIAHEQIQGTMEDTATQITGQAIQQSQIETPVKEALLTSLSLFSLAGTVGTIGGIITIFKKYS